MLDAIPYWLHLLAAAAWIGPQLMMFLVIAPGLGGLDQPARLRLMRTITLRFGWLGGGALAVLVVTGLGNIDRYAPADMFDLRYGYILAVKLVLVAVVILLTLAHSLVAGPRLLRLQEAALNATQERAKDLTKARRLSIVLSALTLLSSLAVLFCAALLRGPFAFQGA